MKLKCPHLLKPLDTLINENYLSFDPSEPFRFPLFDMRHPVVQEDFEKKIIKNGLLKHATWMIKKTKLFRIDFPKQIEFLFTLWFSILCPTLTKNIECQLLLICTKICLILIFQVNQQTLYKQVDYLRSWSVEILWYWFGSQFGLLSKLLSRRTMLPY